MQNEMSTCKQWINEVSWGMIHEDAITRFLEWGNNHYHDHMRAPVTNSGEYSVYFVVDTWEEPKVALLKMNNYGAQTLCEKKLPPEMAERFLEHVGNLKGIHGLTEEVKDWVADVFENA